MRIVEYNAVSAISRSSMAELDYALNAYSGCFHGCIYCYAMDFTRIQDAAQHWGQVVYVKKNLLHLLRSEIKTMKRGIVGVSTITDPYQPAEAVYHLSGSAIEILLRAGFRVTVQTKSPLVLRDRDILQDHRNLCDVGITITTMNQKKALLLEPQSPSPLARGRALSSLSSSGIRTWIFLGPIINGINDSPSDMEQIFQLAADTGSRVIYDTFSNYKGATMLMAERIGSSDMAGQSRYDIKWKEKVMSDVQRLSDRYSVKCNSQDQEWLEERRMDYRTLY